MLPNVVIRSGCGLMGVFRGIKEKLRSESKRFTTTALVVCFVALPLLVLTLFPKNSTFGLFGTTTQVWGKTTATTATTAGEEQVAENIVEGNNAQNVEPSSCVDDGKNPCDRATSLPDEKGGNETLAFKSVLITTNSQLSGSSEGSISPNNSTEPIQSDKGSSSGDDSYLFAESSKGSHFGNDSSQPAESISKGSGMSGDKLHGGLLAPKFDDRSCLSRYQSFLYRKPLPQKPSSYLIAKLRNYEKIHQHCGPYSKFYSKSVKSLKSGQKLRTTDCKYLVWTPSNGLGNRMLSMAASFLFALLTDRVLLLDYGSDMDDLFCEPFPNTSWLLAKNFPLRKEFRNRTMRDANVLLTMPRNDVNNMSTMRVPSYLHLDLLHGNYGRDSDRDWNFYCDQGQAFLQHIPWLIISTDQYFAPSFFLMPSFKQEVSQLFPQKDTLFHFLGSYLFSPSNQAWGLITRFYDAYLAKADERVGLQIRVFHPKGDHFQSTMDQILECTLKEKLLPEVDNKILAALQQKDRPLKAVLVTSLLSTYYENIRDMYWRKPTVTGEVIGVYQPSHEEYQHKGGDNEHNMKALAEMYLLSLCDVLVTTAWSTFGYVSQSLGGLNSWILLKPVHGNKLDQPCRQAVSIEPCFHYPPNFDCKTHSKIDTGKIVPFIKRCEDRERGVKLVNDHKYL